MYRFVVSCGSLAALLATSVSAAWVGVSGPIGGPINGLIPLPIVEGGLLGLLAAGVIGGAWLARRKRQR